MISRQDNAIMKSIAFLTMGVLPATFISVGANLSMLLKKSLISRWLTRIRRSSVLPSSPFMMMAGKHLTKFGSMVLRQCRRL